MTHNTTPLAVTVQQACHLSGYGPTTIWALLRDGSLRAVRVPGIRRTLVAYDSLCHLLGKSSVTLPPCRRPGTRATPKGVAR
jgi:hypothetical protein